ncbi:MAG: DUF4382 domain-containing protein [Candidatus Omnitrophica bacterium]|nr:DUF4382 domain-containing protein [Candidatus Omnitrophota bacterium]
MEHNLLKKWVISIAPIPVYILLTLVASSPAADTLTAFNTTVQKLEVSKDGGATFFTVFDNNTAALDLVALSGQNVGTFLGEAKIPEGTYNFYRVLVTSASLTFRVDGTGETSGSTNLNANTTGTLTVNLNNFACCPRTETGTMNVSCKEGGVTEAVINFDAATSVNGLQYQDADGAGSGTTVVFQGVTFAPVINVAT